MISEYQAMAHNGDRLGLIGYDHQWYDLPDLIQKVTMLTVSTVSKGISLIGILWLYDHRQDY